MSADRIATDKDRQRKLAYRCRAAALATETSAAAQLSSRVAAALDGRLDGAVVSAFLTIRTEIDTTAMIASLADCGAGVVLPTINGDDPDLVFRRYAPGDDLAHGAFGVREPLASATVCDPSILIVPLLAFDRDGYRLGYGGGYYDRAIARLSRRGAVLTVGVGYDGQEVVHVPRENHDERLTMIVTPTRTLLMGFTEPATRADGA